MNEARERALATQEADAALRRALAATRVAIGAEEMMAVVVCTLPQGLAAGVAAVAICQ